MIAEAEGRVEFGNDYKAKRRIRVVPLDGDQDAVEYLLPKGRPLAVNEGDVVRKGDLLLDGSPVPHDILEHSWGGGACRLSGQGNSGCIPVARCENQRQAYRGDCPPDVAKS